MIKPDDLILKQQIVQHEGKRNTAYKDTKGILTIGIGHNLNVPLSDQIIHLIYVDDVYRAYADCANNFIYFQTLDDVRQRVIVDMCFNMGVEKLKAFKKMHLRLENKDYDGAANEMLASDWYDQVGSRSVRLTAMMRDGFNHP